MKIRQVSLIAGGVIVIITAVFAAFFVLNTPPTTRVDSPETDVEVAISDDLTITNQILSFVDEGNGNYLIRYQYTINHGGNYPALNLSASSWFNDTPQNTFQVISLTTSSSLNLNLSFDGKSDRSLLSGSNFLPALSSAQIVLTIRLSYGDISRQFINFIETAGDAGNASSSSSASSSMSSSSSSSSISSIGSTSSSSSTTGTGSTTSSSTSTPTTTTSTSITVTVSTPDVVVGAGGSDNSLYDADQISFPLSPLSSTATTTPAPVGKGM